jgi:peptide/nickel transport system substrate-binding protein
MRLRTPLVALSSAGLLVLAACGGSGSSSPNNTSNTPFTGGNTGNNQCPTCKGPVTISGAQKGGTVTVLTLNGLTTPIDPSENYFTDTLSIMTNLVDRTLTQYKYDPKSGQMILVPDLATDLGQHNDDYTKWTFTIRPGVKWQNGQPVTAKEIAWGMTRCMDVKTFPTGACINYNKVYFKGGAAYKGPYTSHEKSGTIFPAIQVSGNKITIHMAKPFPDMPYWGAFPENGPVPIGSASDPTTYKNKPWSTGPYEIKSFSPSKELVLVRNKYWDPSTDPARTQYPAEYDIKSQQPSEKTDQILLADSGSGQTTLTYDNMLAPDYQQMKAKDPSRLTTGGTPCTIYWGPDNRKIKSKTVREALAWAFPYKDVILAGGSIPGVTAIPATNLFPPGMPARTPYNVTGRKGFDNNVQKARQLLQQAHAMGYNVRFLFETDDPNSVKEKDAIVKAFTQAGFKATPVPTTVANYEADVQNPNENVNLRHAGWCSDWLSGSTWIPPVLGSTNPDKSGTLGSNWSAFSSPSVDHQINAIQSLPLAQQPAAWNNLDQHIAQKYFPIFTEYYLGVDMAHGSRIMGMNNDNLYGMPTWKTMWVKGG